MSAIDAYHCGSVPHNKGFFLYSRINMQSRCLSPILTPNSSFDLLNSDRLYHYTDLVLKAQAFFLLEHGSTLTDKRKHKLTEAT